MRADPPSLYRRALGKAFERLPQPLRDFHTRPEGRARGVLCVTRGKGWLRNLLAGLLRLPPAGKCVPIRLQVTPWGDGERWVRHFGERRLETRQWLRHGLLIEAAGPLRFGFRLHGDPEGLRFEFVRTWWWGMPLPRPLSPRVAAHAGGTDTGWVVHVRVETPLLGMLAEYQGEVTPE